MGTSKVIDSFTGPYEFLSNFSNAEVVFDGKKYPTVEHAYQAAKTFDLTSREAIRRAKTAGIAKRMGKSIRLRNDWETVKLQIMEDLLLQKFKDPIREYLLIGTGSAQLFEGNTWGDRFWGTVNGEGANHLGRLLMKIREYLQHETPSVPS